MPTARKLRIMSEDVVKTDMSLEAFEALRFMLRFAKGTTIPNVRLETVKREARFVGFSEDALNEAVHEWAAYEAKKGYYQ